MDVSIFTCPLCASRKIRRFCDRQESGISRTYLKCPSCALIFLHPEQRLTALEEKKHYDSHQNYPEDENYLNFLNRLASPLMLKLKPGAEGLDYGCGPGPGMSRLFERKGFVVINYDPFYFPEKTPLLRRYDFISCSEVAEHWHSPGNEFQQLQGMLKKGGFLGLMTGILEDESLFSGWWYPKDPTHVCFYQEPTIKWVAQKMGWTIDFFNKNVIIFKK